ncbi:MAG: MBOAT family protein [Clostridiales bacterium]|nr:MBOAT family protein [Clostridiales bacterium]
MLFSSLTFLIWFLPIVLVIHFVLPQRLRNGFLLLASLFFYAWGEIAYLPLIVVVLVLNVIFGMLIDQSANRTRTVMMTLAVMFNIGTLVFYKYSGFLMGIIGLSAYAPSVTMPLGISFFTFQITGYIIDVYRKEIPAEKNFINVMTFIVLFPQLIAGPIVLYTDVHREMRERSITAADLERGMTIFIAGLGAKVLLANPLGALNQDILSIRSASAPAVWLATGASVLQLYFDFAGYSSMAIGMGHMMGFKFPQNFNHPLSARSMRDFWRRWHMTLGGWLRDYVYIPLGGSHKGARRTVLNLFFVWFLSGFWHGADWNHILWGLWFFIFVALERTSFGTWIDQRPKLGLLYAQTIFFLSLPLFSYSSLHEAGAHFARMFTPVFDTDVLYYLRGHAVLFLIAIAFCMPSVFRLFNQLFEKRPFVRILMMSCVMILCLAALVNEAYNPFIYFRF